MEYNNVCSADYSDHNNDIWIKRVKYLPSEEISFFDKTADGGICLTNYRLILYCRHQGDIISIPTLLIRICEPSSSLFHMDIVTKIGTTFTCHFKSVRSCEAWIKQINNFCNSPKDFLQMFALLFREELKKRSCNHPMLAPAKEIFDIRDDMALEAAMTFQEFKRLGFNNNWKITDVNSTFQVCQSYPKYHIMPREISDQYIPNIATFRSHQRFPSVVWRSRKTGAVLLRCAQPRVGIMYSRNEFDEQLVATILENCRKESYSIKNQKNSCKFLIIDARNYGAAQLNRLRGGGFEYMEYYEQSQIRFMDLPNLHSVRMSFERLMLLYKKIDPGWFASLERSLWLSYISQLLKAAVEITEALDVDGSPVMVHCTDGWDRTPQLTSLAELLLDPYYRTIQGFRILVEREWLQFGHKFGDRCGHSFDSCSNEEQSPIFLQWLDCVRQVQCQFPSSFEFNELFLVKLAINTYSGLFGSFLFNSELERQENHCASQTCSIWAFLNPNHNWSIINYLYEQNIEVLNPSWDISKLELWSTLYVNALLPPNVSGNPSQPAAPMASVRQVSDTSDPYKISISSPSTSIIAGTNSGHPLNGSPSSSVSIPTPTAISETELHASSSTLTNVRRRSQSLSDVNSKQLDLSTLISATLQMETGAASLLLQAKSPEQAIVPPTYTSLSVPNFLLIAPSDGSPTADAKMDQSTNDNNFNTYVSDWNLATSTPNKLSPRRHTRSASDPPFSSANRRLHWGFTVSNLGDSDVLIVNRAPLGGSHYCDGANRLMTVENGVSSAATKVAPHPQSTVGGDSFEKRPICNPTTQPKVPLMSSFSPMRQSAISLSGVAFDGVKALIEDYFGGPVFGANFQKLADDSMSASENKDSTAFQGNPPSIGQVKEDGFREPGFNDDSSSKSFVLHHTRLNRAMKNERFCYVSTEKLPRSTSPLTQRISDQANSSINPVCDFAAFREHPATYEHSTSANWDGLSLRIDPVTLKFHKRRRHEYRLRMDHQLQIDRLKANISFLMRVVGRLRSLLGNTATSSHTLHEIIATPASSYAALSPSSLDSFKTTVDQLYSQRDGPMTSIIEALSDAIDNRQEINDCGGCNGFCVKTNKTSVEPLNKMNQSATDDILLNWPDESAVHATTCPYNPSRRRSRYCPSTSSDYSSFDVVETSTLPTYSSVPDGPTCGGCDRLLDAVVSPLSCSCCIQSFCGDCSETPRVFNNCNPICNVCYHKCLLEANEASHPITDFQRDLVLHEGVYHQIYSAPAPATPPGSHSRNTTSLSSPACVDRDICRRLELHFPSGPSLTCSSTHSQNGTAKA